MLEQVAVSPPEGPPDPGMETSPLTSPSLALAGSFFTISATREVLKYNTNELIYETEAGPHVEAGSVVAKEGSGSGKPWGFGLADANHHM